MRRMIGGGEINVGEMRLHVITKPGSGANSQ